MEWRNDGSPRAERRKLSSGCYVHHGTICDSGFGRRDTWVLSRHRLCVFRTRSEVNNTFDNPSSVTQTAKEYLAERLQKEKLKQMNFAANTGAAPLVVPLRVKAELQEQFCRHTRFVHTDLVDLAWLSKTYLRGAAKSFPLTDRATCVAVLLSAIAYGQMPASRKMLPEEGRRFRV
jgi:hypothetical protein